MKQFEKLRIELLQKSFNYISAKGIDGMHADQIILLFNALLSEQVINGQIDLSG